MKLLKICASFIGFFAVLFGSSSCDKDENRCCTYSYMGATLTVCEDDELWKQDYDTWEEFVEYAESNDYDCN